MQLLKNSWKFSFYLFSKLPLAWLMGIRISYADKQQCRLVLPFRRRNLNPFGSMYFAAQLAAAEMSTGLLVMTACHEQGNMSMLVTHISAEFTKKAVTDLSFECSQGDMIFESVLRASNTGEPVIIEAASKGFDLNRNQVCTVKIQWSVKKRAS